MMALDHTTSVDDDLPLSVNSVKRGSRQANAKRALVQNARQRRRGSTPTTKEMTPRTIVRETERRKTVARGRVQVFSDGGGQRES